MSKLRVIFDPPLSGFENMSRDIVLLEENSLPLGDATWRFFEWSEETLSVGRFQKTTDLDRYSIEKRNIPLVRRPTGGRAILHQREVTFSFAQTSAFPLNPRLSYQRVQNLLVRVLYSLGLEAEFGKKDDQYLASPYCFSLSMAHELKVGGKKVVGVAQARGKNRILFQGSLMLSVNREKIAACFKDKEKIKKELDQNLLALDEVLDKVPSRQDLYQLFLEIMTEEWAEEIKISSWSEEEIKKGKELLAGQYHPASSFHWQG